MKYRSTGNLFIFELARLTQILLLKHIQKLYLKLRWIGTFRKKLSENKHSSYIAKRKQEGFSQKRDHSVPLEGSWVRTITLTICQVSASFPKFVWKQG